MAWPITKTTVIGGSAHHQNYTKLRHRGRSHQLLSFRTVCVTAVTEAGHTPARAVCKCSRCGLCQITLAFCFETGKLMMKILVGAVGLSWYGI